MSQPGSTLTSAQHKLVEGQAKGARALLNAVKKHPLSEREAMKLTASPQDQEHLQRVDLSLAAMTAAAGPPGSEGCVFSAG